VQHGIHGVAALAFKLARDSYDDKLGLRLFQQYCTLMAATAAYSRASEYTSTWKKNKNLTRLLLSNSCCMDVFIYTIKREQVLELSAGNTRGNLPSITMPK
jgi:hypothetical protein